MATLRIIKTQLQKLLDKANEVTGNNDTTLTDAQNTLIAGYGTGSSMAVTTMVVGENVIPVLGACGVTVPGITMAITTNAIGSLEV